MKWKKGRLVAATLLVVSVFSACSACLWYMQSPLSPSTPCCFEASLGAFTAVFLMGFCSFRLPILYLLASARCFSLTLAGIFFLDTLPYLLWGPYLAFVALRALLFVAFCRLAYLYGKRQQIPSPNHLRYLLQYMGDYLFQCGMEVMLCFIGKQMTHLLRFL